MEYLTKIYDMWLIKLIIGSVIMIFAPFKVGIWILFAFIITDTITGCFNAIRTRKFSSRKFQKSVKKIATYFTAIVVVRLLEIGIASIIETTMITRLITSFLILTEAISILENLTLLGVPLPPEVLKIILGNLNFGKFYDIFGKGFDKQRYLTEIDEIIQYQVPVIKSSFSQKLLRIKLEEWQNAINIIDEQMSGNSSNNNDLLFYRISSLANTTNNLINEKWVEEGIPKEYINAFNDCHKQRISKWISNIKTICYSSESIENKKKAVIEGTITALYETVIDIQKGEDLLSNCK